VHVVDRAMKLGERILRACESSPLGVATCILLAERSEGPVRNHGTHVWTSFSADVRAAKRIDKETDHHVKYPLESDSLCRGSLQTYCKCKVESSSSRALIGLPSAPLSFSNWRPVGNLSSLKHAHPTMWSFWKASSSMTFNLRRDKSAPQFSNQVLQAAVRATPSACRQP